MVMISGRLSKYHGQLSRAAASFACLLDPPPCSYSILRASCRHIGKEFFGKDKYLSAVVGADGCVRSPVKARNHPHRPQHRERAALWSGRHHRRLFGVLDQQRDTFRGAKTVLDAADRDAPHRAAARPRARFGCCVIGPSVPRPPSKLSPDLCEYFVRLTTTANGVRLRRHSRRRDHQRCRAHRGVAESVQRAFIANGAATRTVMLLAASDASC